MKLTKTTFGRLIKERFSQYKDIADDALADLVLDKYPTYRGALEGMFATPAKASSRTFEERTEPYRVDKRNIDAFRQMRGMEPLPDTPATAEVQPPAQASTPTAPPGAPTAPQKATFGRNPHAEKFTIPQSVHDAIAVAGEGDPVLTSLLYDIALQESSFDPSNSAKKGGYKDSTAQGLFMFNDPTWETVKNYQKMTGSTLKLPSDDRSDPLTSAMAAAYLIKNGQLGRWYPSAPVWGPHYSPEELAPYFSQTKPPTVAEISKHLRKS